MHFNFKFNLSEDTYAQDSIDLLQHSGIQFEKHAEDGIDPLHFAELLVFMLEPKKNMISDHKNKMKNEQSKD